MQIGRKKLSPRSSHRAYVVGSENGIAGTAPLVFPLADHPRRAFFWTAGYRSSPNQGRIRVPRALPANAAISHTQPCKLEEETPEKNAPILQPYAMRAPYPSNSPPIIAARSDRAGTRHTGEKRPASPAAINAPRMIPKFSTEVMSLKTLASKVAAAAGDCQ